MGQGSKEGQRGEPKSGRLLYEGFKIQRLEVVLQSVDKANRFWEQRRLSKGREETGSGGVGCGGLVCARAREEARFVRGNNGIFISSLGGSQVLHFFYRDQNEEFVCHGGEKLLASL